MKKNICLIAFILLNINLNAQSLNKFNPILEIGGTFILKSPISVYNYEGSTYKFKSEYKLSGGSFITPNLKYGVKYMFSNFGLNLMVGMPNKYNININSVDSNYVNEKWVSNGDFNSEISETFIPLDFAVTYSLNKKIDLLINKTFGFKFGNRDNLSSVDLLSLKCNIKSSEFKSVILGIDYINYDFSGRYFNTYAVNIGYRYAFKTKPIKTKKQIMKQESIIIF